jgi:hypothetical protein
LKTCEEGAGNFYNVIAVALTGAHSNFLVRSMRTDRIFKIKGTSNL